MKKLFKILLSFIAFCMFTFAVVQPLNMSGNWYQQFMPNLNNEPIRDIIFLDSLTGFAVTGDGLPNDSNYILKTTNGGDNWIIKYRAYRDFYRVKFINANTGFVCGGFNISSGTLLKTTNGGENWNEQNTPGRIWYEDMSVSGEDTLWLVLSSSLDGGVFFTSNGGVNWQPQFSGGNQNPNKIYMFNSRIGFISNNSASPNIYRTTNSGWNWSVNLPGENFFYMQFVDSLIGWKSSTASNLIDSSMKKTTNGGTNWFKQNIPRGPNIIQFGVAGFQCLNKDTLWAVGNSFFYPNSQVRGVLMRTTNGGANWKFQVPDTASVTTTIYYYIKFIGKNNAWAYDLSKGIHTTNGGDTTFYLGLQQISSEIPTEFKLYQNYPNPFNPKTIIRFQINRLSDLKLVVYDITGREIAILVNEEQRAGTYEVDFNGSNYSSGIYFYKLTVSGKEQYTATKKMILVK